MKKTLLGVVCALALTLVTVAPAAANIVWATLAPIACEVDTERLWADYDYNMEVAADLGAADPDADWYLHVYQYQPSAVEHLVETAILMEGC